MSHDPQNTDIEPTAAPDFCFRGKSTKNSGALIRKGKIAPPPPSFGKASPLLTHDACNEAGLYIYERKHVKAITWLVMFLRCLEKEFNVQVYAVYDYFFKKKAEEIETPQVRGFD